MKKIVLVLAIGIAGMLSAKSHLNLERKVKIESKKEKKSKKENAAKEMDPIPSKKCVGVMSDCGEGGYWFACAYPNETEGEVDHEVVDDMRQMLNEAFCGYGD